MSKLPISPCRSRHRRKRHSRPSLASHSCQSLRPRTKLSNLPYQTAPQVVTTRPHRRPVPCNSTARGRMTRPHSPDRGDMFGVAAHGHRGRGAVNAAAACAPARRCMASPIVRCPSRRVLHIRCCTRAHDRNCNRVLTALARHTRLLEAEASVECCKCCATRASTVEQAAQHPRCGEPT